MMNTSRDRSELRTPNRLSWALARFAGIILAPRDTLAKLVNEPGAWVPILIVALSLIGVRLVDLPGLMARFSDPVYVHKYIEQNDVDSIRAVQEIENFKSAFPFITIFSAPLLVAANVITISIVLYLIGRIVFRCIQRFALVLNIVACLLYTSPSPRDLSTSRMPSSA